MNFKINSASQVTDSQSVSLCVQHVLDAFWPGLASPHVKFWRLKLAVVWWPVEIHEMRDELVCLLPTANMQ